MGREQARPRTGHGRHSSNLGDVDEEDEEDLSMNSNMLLNGSSKSQFHDSMDFDLHNSVTGSQRGGGGGGDDLFENTQKGDKIISASRCIFFSVLFVAAAVLATVAFLLYRQEETETFERAVRFVLPAAAVVVSSQTRIRLYVFLFFPSLSCFFLPNILCSIFYGTIVYESSRRNYAIHESQRRYRIRDIAWIVNVHNDDGQTDGGIGHG